MHRVSTRLRAAVVAGGVTVAAGFGLAASAPADDAARGAELAPAKIKMVFGQGPPTFVGDPSVASGQELKVVNRTNPRRIGPHFFSISNAGDIPDTRPEIKACNKGEDICGQIFRAHRVNFQKQKVGRKLVKRGMDGWDKEFTNTSKGDSWFTQRKGTSKTQIVSASEGTTLSFFCAFHRGMQGEIEVTAP